MDLPHGRIYWTEYESRQIKRADLYFGNNFSGDERARIRFYRNDGPAGPSGTLSPNTVLYDTGFFNISAAAAATLTLANLALLVPNTFTWTILFSGLAADEQAGLNLYGPPVVGNNYTDYWEKNGSETAR